MIVCLNLQTLRASLLTVFSIMVGRVDHLRPFTSTDMLFQYITLPLTAEIHTTYFLFIELAKKGNVESVVQIIEMWSVGNLRKHGAQAKIHSHAELMN